MLNTKENQNLQLWVQFIWEREINDRFGVLHYTIIGILYEYRNTTLYEYRKHDHSANASYIEKIPVDFLTIFHR